MFLKNFRLNSADFSRERIKRTLPFFVPLLVSCLIFFVGGLLSARAFLRHVEWIETEQLFEQILAELSSNPNISGMKGAHLSGLPMLLHPDMREKKADRFCFLRVAEGKQQLLLTGNDSIVMDFAALTSLPVSGNGVWLFLPNERQHSDLVVTVVSHKIGDDSWLQVARESGTSWQLYRKVRVVLFFSFLATGLLFWLLALILVKISLGPLTKTRERIVRLARQSQTDLLPEQGNGEEFDQLYRQINALVRHNRFLVTEIQQGLDNVAHDLRTPMTRLRAVAEYSLHEENPQRLREALSDCLEEAEQVLQMLQVMMSVAEAEAGTMRLELKKNELQTSLQRAVMLYEYVAEEKRISVELFLDESLLVLVDETRITQVWANLLDNAIKYGQANGEGWVRISGRRDGTGVAVSFADNGQGISSAEQGRIWERLYRGDRSRSEKGLGLGLSYVKAVVEAHGGRVTVKSALNEGACFTVWLPATDDLTGRG